MPLFFNLAALTGEELERLLGEAAAQKLRPDVSRARMEGKPYRGPELAAALRFEPLGQAGGDQVGGSQAGARLGGWGATPQHARRLSALAGELRAQDFTELGAVYLPGALEARHQLALCGAGHVAAALRWSETLGERAEAPFAQLLSLLRDRASGFTAVLTSTARRLPAPTLSPEVALRHLPGAGAGEALAVHLGEVARHGRASRVTGLADWARVQQAARALNVAAWSGRGALIELAEHPA